MIFQRAGSSSSLLPRSPGGSGPEAPEAPEAAGPKAFHLENDRQHARKNMKLVGGLVAIFYFPIYWE